MEGNIEKKIFRSSIFGEEKEKLQPRGCESPEDDDSSSPEQTEESKKTEEKALTKEAQEKYAEELKEITKLAKESRL